MLKGLTNSSNYFPLSPPWPISITLATFNFKFQFLKSFCVCYTLAKVCILWISFFLYAFYGPGEQISPVSFPIQWKLHISIFYTVIG